jgi:uncharacterized protein YbgA (DUF1722 family)/uncharacterized protein YbbK (DUF523 family)
MTEPLPPAGKITVGISACLLGERVRYDGGQKLDRFLVETLGRYFTYVPVCPEVECGLPVPRESMHLEGDAADPRLVTLKTREDHTVRMREWVARRVNELRTAGLHAYIFKSDSPSCGLFRVKLFTEHDRPAGVGAGLWARVFAGAFSGLPMEEEGRLCNPDIRENFIERVFAHKRFRDEVGAAPSADALMRFQARNKLLIMAHAPGAVAELGSLAAATRPETAAEQAADYEQRLLAALVEQATVPRHVNVLQHMLGYFRERLPDGDRRELEDAILQYQRELVPLIVPITLFRHFIRACGEPYLAEQTYLNPHPAELKLRNHA